jgi:hypothetical protein
MVVATTTRVHEKGARSALIFPLVPKFHLGTPLAPREISFRALILPPPMMGSAMKLPPQARSQMKFGNEENGRALRAYFKIVAQSLQIHLQPVT